MNANLGLAVDQIVFVLLVALLQLTLFAGLALILMPFLRHRTVARHHVAISVLVFALASPVTASLSNRFGWTWFELPTWHLRVSELAQAAPSLKSSSNAPSEADVGSKTIRSAEVTRTAEPKEPAISSSVPKDFRSSREFGKLESPSVHVDQSVVPESKQADLSSLNSPSSGEHSPEHPENALSSMFSTGESVRWLLRGFVAVWFMGMAVQFVLSLRSSARIGSLIRRAYRVADPRALSIVQGIARGLGLRRSPELLASATVLNPFVTGMITPRIVVPESLLKLTSDSQLSHVLLHECTHVARQDIRFGYVQRWATIFFWFHPLVYVHARILSQAREELCDNQVLSIVPAADYARTLLSLAEQLAGLTAYPSVVASLLSGESNLETRIARLLAPHRDRTLRLGRAAAALLVVLMLILGTVATGICGPHLPALTEQTRSDNAIQDSSADEAKEEQPRNLADQGPNAAAADSAELTAADVTRELGSRGVLWLQGGSPRMQNLKYDFYLGSKITPISISRGDQRRVGVWHGVTLRTGLHSLTTTPEKFDVQLIRTDTDKEAGTLRLVVKPKDSTGAIRLEIGNGVESSWQGYFSRGAREMTLVVSSKSLIPMEEKAGDTTIKYGEWKEVEAGHFVPGRIDVEGSHGHWRMHFDWLADAVWLLRFSESILADGQLTLSRTRNVQVNSKPVARELSEDEVRSSEVAQFVRSMLDHNRPWLDPGATGAGWKPPFKTISYSFHTLREDVRESCVLDGQGQAVFEVSTDGQGKMKQSLGHRKIALNTGAHASAVRGQQYARIYRRSSERESRPYDLALLHYARIGCQFDLPLFQFRDQLETAQFELAEGKWNDQGCRVVSVTNLGREAPLSCGTMLGFSSWSFVHHIYPKRQTLYVDPVRNVPMHETLLSTYQDKVFEIDYGDYVEVEPGQWAPRSIRVESPGYFHCDYQFQLIGGTHWLLAEVTSWFDAQDKSRGVVEDVQVNGNRELLDETLEQVSAAQNLFGNVGEATQAVDVATLTFRLGEDIQAGPYKLHFTVSDRRSVVVSVEADQANRALNVPLCVLDEQRRVLFAPSIPLAEVDGKRRGTLEMRGSTIWDKARFLAVPLITPATKAMPVSVVSLEWDKPIRLNVPDAEKGTTREDEGETNPREGRTRAVQLQIRRSTQNEAKAELKVVSIDGPQDFWLDLSVAMLSESGELLATGHVSTNLRVEYQPVEQQFELNLATMGAKEPRYVAIGVSPGNVTSMPLGSTWGSLMDVRPPFDAVTLLSTSDESCWRAGLAAVAAQEVNRSIEKEFLSERKDERRLGDGPYSRRTLLKPHRNNLIRIAREARSADLVAAAIRFLTYLEDEQAASVLQSLLSHNDSSIVDQASVGLTFLGGSQHVERLKEILNRTAPSWQTDTNNRRRYDLLEKDVIIALGKLGTKEATALLKQTLQDASRKDRVELIQVVLGSKRE